VLNAIKDAGAPLRGCCAILDRVCARWPLDRMVGTEGWRSWVEQKDGSKQ